MSSSQYFEPAPSARSRPRTLRLTLPDLTLELMSDTGVFSAERIDPGTKYLLLETPAPQPESSPVLDLGCGYGPIAVTLALRCPDIEVFAVDVNQRARDLARSNSEALGVSDRVQVLHPDEVPPQLSFGEIWSNPPIRIGKSALHELLARWLARLRQGGAAHLVVHRNLGADSLARWLQASGFPTARRGSRSGYRLLEVTRP